MKSLPRKAFEERLWVTDNIEIVRTEPHKGKDAPYVGFIRTTKGEAKVDWNNNTLLETLLHGGREISEKEYWTLNLNLLEN